MLSKEVIKEALKPTNEITYPVYLTIQEIMLAEEALFDRSTVLAAIADVNTYSKRIDKGVALDKKVLALEKIARKIALPLDEMYMANDSLEKV
jgi:hypothetical protein